MTFEQKSSRTEPLMTPERFEEGITLEQFEELVSRDDDRWQDARTQNLEFDSEIPRKAMSASGNSGSPVAVIAEPWCPYCVEGIALLDNINRQSQKARGADVFDVRIFRRDENRELMDQYRSGDKRRIPVIIFMDQDYRELGHWIGMPDTAEDLLAERKKEAHREILDGYAEDYRADAVREMMALLE